MLTSGVLLHRLPEKLQPNHLLKTFTPHDYVGTATIHDTAGHLPENDPDQHLLNLIHNMYRTADKCVPDRCGFHQIPDPFPPETNLSCGKIRYLRIQNPKILYPGDEAPDAPVNVALRKTIQNHPNPEWMSTLQLLVADLRAWPWQTPSVVRGLQSRWGGACTSPSDAS